MKPLGGIMSHHHLTTTRYDRPYYYAHFAEETNPKHRQLKPKVTATILTQSCVRANSYPSCLLCSLTHIRRDLSFIRGKGKTG